METTPMTFKVQSKRESYVTHTPMTFIIDIPSIDYPSSEWQLHPLRMEWENYPVSHPLYGTSCSFTVFLKQEYNINMIDWVLHNDMIQLIFKSEQDYILWQLHQ